MTLTPLLPTTTFSVGGPEHALAHPGDGEGMDAGVFGAALAAAGGVPPCRSKGASGTALGLTLDSFGALLAEPAAGSLPGGGPASPAPGEPGCEPTGGSAGAEAKPDGTIVDPARADLAMLAQLIGLPGSAASPAARPALPAPTGTTLGVPTVTAAVPPVAAALVASAAEGPGEAGPTRATAPPAFPPTEAVSPGEAVSPAAIAATSPHDVASPNPDASGPEPIVDVLPELAAATGTPARVGAGTARPRSDGSGPGHVPVASPIAPGAAAIGSSSPPVTAAQAGQDPEKPPPVAPDPPAAPAPTTSSAAAPAAPSTPAATASAPAPAGAALAQGATPTGVPEQVLRHLTSVRALREGGHRTVLRLEPEHLGAVTVTVDVRAGAVRMAVSGGAEALAAVREGLDLLRTSLASSGLDLGDVTLRSDTATGAPAPAGTTTQGVDGRDSGAGPRPDAGAGGPGTDHRPGREQQSTAAEPVDEPSTPRRAAAAPDDLATPGGRMLRLDVRI